MKMFVFQEDMIKGRQSYMLTSVSSGNKMKACKKKKKINANLVRNFLSDNAKLQPTVENVCH